VDWPFRRVAVAEDSMRPTLLPGDWLIARRTRRIRPGQVVLAWHPSHGRHSSRDGLLLVKRAVRRVDGGWWLASDNPLAPGAADSSRFGPVPEDKVVGRVLARYFPFRTVRLFPASPGQPETQ
jgi:nickel-type superoxide dismutase maturation protease